MLVRHNELDLTIKDVLDHTGQTSKYDIKYLDNRLYAKGIVKPDNKTFLGYPFDRYGDYYQKFTIKNIGNAPLIVKNFFQNNIYQENKVLLENESIEITKAPPKSGYVAWINILNIDEFDRTYALEIIDFMLTKDGFPDIYLPNKNTLPEDKQPLLPPEGNYKEIQAL